MDGRPEGAGSESLATAGTIGEVVRYWARATPEAPAISARNKRDLSYHELMALADRMARQLVDAGFGRGSRLAVLHRGGAEMMTTMLGIVNCAVAVPVSDEVTAGEFASYLEACRLDGVIVDARLDTPARELAQAKGLPVIEVRGGQEGDPAGHVALDLPAAGGGPPAGGSGPDDLAFVFGTSGTTRASKLVPLRHRHMVARSHSTAVLHELTTDDRCFNQNRLFLCSGISNGCTALYAGGCVAHPDERGRFDLRKFIDGLSTLRPSWYVASYNFNIAVHDALATDASAVAGHSLRFIRATSGHLDPTIVTGLERIFGVPVIEAYSSTESGRICGNPLPPRRRKPGTVGLPTLHSEVAIVDDGGAPLGRGQTGEVVVRGANVFDGYEGVAAANAAAFFGDWYRTGDVGVFDDDGYLTLVGRIKEMINRGGQKISPVEIDDALLAHPDVADAAAFGIPHPTLGEVVGAAVVVRANARLTEADLSTFLRDRLEPMKWPRTLAFVERIPRGPSGKVRRYQVAELFETLRATSPTPLGEGSSGADGAATPTEARLAMLWTMLLQREGLHVDDDFFLVGGDSLAATQLLLTVNEVFHVEMGLESVFGGGSTIRTMAATIDKLAGQPLTGRSPDLPMVSVDERIARHRADRKDRAGGRASTQGPGALDREVFDLFVLDKRTGLRRLRPGARFGSVQANSDGYRSPEIPRLKPPGVVRFAVLGDSMAFGSWHGGEAATWPWQALETLRSAHADLAYDYVNAAIPGNGVRHVTIQFRDSISTFQPDVVMLLPGAGGSRADWARRKLGYSGVHYVPTRFARRSRWIGLVEKNLVIRLRQVRALTDRGKLSFEPHELRELSSAFQRKLHDLVTECQRTGALVVLLTRESMIQRGQSRVAQIRVAGSRLFYEPYMSVSALNDVKDEFNRVNREVAARTGALLVDLVGTLPPTRTYFEDTSHCTAEANKVIGAHVSRVLSESPRFQELLRSRARSTPAV